MKKKWDNVEFLEHLEEFNKLYNERPIKDNNGGMKSPHMFHAWFVVKKLQPEYLIESGVWKGLGTWFFEQASPKTKIISIDPNPINRIYTSPKVEYLTQDFLNSTWENLPKDTTLIFLDDHQNFWDRLIHCYNLGFKKIMVEDNYPIHQGDCYSPKKILADSDYIIQKDGKREWIPKKSENSVFFKSIIEIYQEMPPIFIDEFTRWGDKWSENYPTEPPLLTESVKSKFPLFYEERRDYTWICYIKLK